MQSEQRCGIPKPALTSKILDTEYTQQCSYIKHPFKTTVDNSFSEIHSHRNTSKMKKAEPLFTTKEQEKFPERTVKEISAVY